MLNTTALNRTHHFGFVAEPDCGRGTVGILWQCLTAIFLSIHTVLHLNVPSQPLSRSSAFWRTAQWVLIGIIGPEVVCWVALSDRYRAHRLKRAWNANQRIAISTMQAFFLLADGWQIRKSDDKYFKMYSLLEDQASLLKTEDREKRRFLNFLADQIPTDREIGDRSKADSVAKTITCVQGVWTAVQIIGRLLCQLEISLLEVTTAAYLFLAVVAYTCCWSKPYGVSLPYCVNDFEEA